LFELYFQKRAILPSFFAIFYQISQKNHTLCLNYHFTKIKYLFIKMHKKLALLSLVTLVFTGCSKSEDTLFTQLDSSDTGINFVNEVKNGEEMNIFKYRNFYNGGGVAIGDINNDGLSDVYFTSNQGTNTLYLNKGNFKFEDISKKPEFKEPNRGQLELLWLILMEMDC